MCRTIEIMRNESEIKGSIKAYKRVNVPDEKMVAYLLEDFDFLSEEEAKKLISEYEDWTFVHEKWISDNKKTT